MNAKFLALVLSLWFGIVYSQTVTIKIIDKDTNEPLEEVFAKDSSTQNIIFSEGNTITINFGQSYLIKKMGYKTIELYVNENTPKTLSLKAVPIELGEVLVNGNLFNDPVMSLTTPDLTKNVVQPKNVADLFNNIEGFSVIKRGNYAIDPSFRAAQYEQLNIQYDGGTKVLHACPNRMDPITTHVIPEDIERVEVIRGPFSVRYGATFGGIINLVTQKPKFDEHGLSGSFATGYESNGNNSVTQTQLQYAKEKFDFLGSYAYRDYGSYEDGAGREIPSSFRSIDYSMRFGYNFSTDERLKLNWRQSFGRDVLHASLPMDSDYDNSSIISLDYHKKKMIGTLNQIKAKFYYSYVDHLMSNTRRANFAAAEASAPVDATTAGGKVETKLVISDNWTTYTGVDVLLIARDGVRNRLVKLNMMGMPLETPMAFQDKIWQDSYINDYGIFAESIYKFNENTSMQFGLRYDLVTSEIQDPDELFIEYYPDLDQRTEHNFSGTVSLKNRLSNNDLVEFAIGRGVRSANMIERGINHFQIGQDPFEYVGNPNLAAEVNHQIEIAYRGQTVFDNQISKIDYFASAYYSQFENYIVGIIDPTKDRRFMPNVKPTNPKVFRNLDNAYKTGFEAGFGISFFDHFSFGSEISYVYTRNEDLGEALPLTTPLRSNFQLTYENKKVFAGLYYTFVAEQNQLAESFGEMTATPGYGLFDIKANYELYKNLNIGIAVINVFDEFYFDHLNFAFRNQDSNNLSGMERLTDPGINASVFVKYRF